MVSNSAQYLAVNNPAQYLAVSNPAQYPAVSNPARYPAVSNPAQYSAVSNTAQSCCEQPGLMSRCQCQQMMNFTYLLMMSSKETVMKKRLCTWPRDSLLQNISQQRMHFMILSLLPETFDEI